MAIENQINAYKAQVNNDVSTQSDPNSIAPDVVGSIGTDLADIILPELLKINNFKATGGTAIPVGGQPKDIYYKSNLNEIQIWRNVNGAWEQSGTIPLGISYPDGIILGLRTSISAYVVTISAGNWAIANAGYSKANQTQLTLNPRDVNFGRWDLIYANTANQILLSTGVPSNIPLKPALPANAIIVDYAYIPPTGSPFLLSGSVSAANISLGKTTLSVPDGEKIINWQSDIVTNDVVTYAQKHGNSIANIQGHQDLDGIMTPYSPNYSYTLNADGTINTLTITDLFTGTITII